MITPDEQLALDMLDALDSRDAPTLDPILTRANRQERRRLEQCCRMTGALLGWLERWMGAPENEYLRARRDSLWQTVSCLHDELGESQRRLWKKAAEIDEAAARLCQSERHP